MIDLEGEGQKEEKLQVQSEFDEMVVWAHETTADASADPYVRGIEDWLTVANQVCLVKCDGGYTVYG